MLNNFMRFREMLDNYVIITINAKQLYANLTMQNNFMRIKTTLNNFMRNENNATQLYTNENNATPLYASLKQVAIDNILQC